MFTDQVPGPDDAGSEVPKKRTPAIIALVVMAAVLAVLLSVSDRPAHKPAAASPVRVAARPSQPAQVAANWAYSSETVELTGEKQVSACTSSPEGARLCFRETEGRLESYLAFPEGDKQFLCTKYHCTTQIKVDDQPVVRVVGSDSPDGNIAMVYLGQPQQLLAALKNASEVALGPPMYDGDGLVLHFKVSGLNDFGNDLPHRPATLARRIPETHDPRLSAPIVPALPPASAQPKLSSPVTIRFGLA
ncbi:MAG: hypothetical protein ACRYFU_18440 [Janthinobacterium lividum]